jgi:hypothetical protein
MAGLAITGYKYSLSISTNNGSTYGAYSEYVLSSWTSGTSFVIASLTNGYLYKIKIRAVNSLGDGAESEETAAFKPNTVPGAPTSVVGASGTRGQSSVSWVAPSDNGGTAVSSYTVQYSTSATFASNITTVSPVSSSSPKLVTGLNPADNGQTYYFRVAATNAGTNGGTGPYSTISAIVTPATVPDAPTIGTMTLSTTDTTDSLAWTAPASNGGSQITGYVYATNNGSTIVEVGTTGNGTATSKTFNPGYTTTTTTIKVAAVNSIGTGPYSSFSAVGHGGWASGAGTVHHPTACVTAPCTCAAPDCSGGCSAPTCTCTCPSCPGGCEDCGTRTPNGTLPTSSGAAGTRTATAGTSTLTTADTNTRTCYRWTRGGQATGYVYNQNSTAGCDSAYTGCTGRTCSACTAGSCSECSAAGACSPCTGGTCGCSTCSGSWSGTVSNPSGAPTITLTNGTYPYAYYSIAFPSGWVYSSQDGNSLYYQGESSGLPCAGAYLGPNDVQGCSQGGNRVVGGDACRYNEF